MHLIFSKDKYVEIFSIVNKSIPSKTPLNILKGFFLEANDNKFIIMANNLELVIKAIEEDLTIVEQGSVVINDKIVDIIRQLPDDEVVLKMDKNTFRVEVSSGDANFVLFGMDPEEYPKFSEEEDWSAWTNLHFTTKEFKKCFRGVTFAVSQDEGKPAFKGILMELKENEQILTALATDTYRLAVFEKSIIQKQSVKEFRLLIPAKMLTEIIRIIDDSETELKCYFKENELVILYKNYIFASRLLDDKFPDLKNAFPPNNNTTIVVNKILLEKMIQRALLLSAEPNQMLSLQIEEDVLKIRAVSDIGKMDEKLLLESKEGENLSEIFLNTRFFYDPLKYLENEMIRIEFNGSLGPCIFSEKNEEKKYNYRYLILPIKTESSNF